MKAIFLKELRSMISSFSLMLAIAVFFILVGLWLWIFPNTSILDNKFATLETLFNLAPWLFLFIFPALTMRSFAEEKANGTLDLLRSKPVTLWNIVTGKFLAVLTILFILVLICQVYTFSVFHLGYPKGNLDIGGIAGSFIGWILLAACYISIGIFASAVSGSQMISFLAAIVLCFLLYSGPAFLSSLPVFVGNLDYSIQWMGMQPHYQSLSKGKLDSTDIFYFLFLSILFLYGSTFFLKRSGLVNKWKTFFLNPGMGAIFLSLVLALLPVFSIDLTEDKRFTFGEETKSFIRNVDDVIYAEVLMDGKLPAAFARLRKSAIDKLQDFNKINKNIQYNLVDPLEGDKEMIKSNQEALRKDGISPTQLTVYNGKDQEKKIIYPYVVFHFGERTMPVNLLEARDPRVDEDEVLNKAVALLEYKFASAIQKLRMKKNPVVVFTRGHDELTPLQTADLERTLRPVYSTGRITLDSVIQITKEIDVLIVAKPQRAFSTRDNFLIDQYIMNGGKVLWFIDPIFVNTDTVNATNKLKQDFIPIPYELNLDELFFKYGFRVEPNIILDYECSAIPLFSGYSGNTPQFEPKKWYFHPLIAPDSRHPIVRNLDRISVFYPATIDTIKTKTEVSKTILLSSSAHSRTLTSPSPINFEMVRQTITPEQFNRPAQPIAILLEGMFPSAFENRVSESFANSLAQIKAEFKSESVPTKMMVFSDGDLPGNAISSRGEPAPLGFNMYEQITYPANKNVILNSIEYMIDDNSIMNARNKQIKLRLLDEAKIEKSKRFWQWFALTLPVILVFSIFLLADYYRKRKYAQI